MINFKDKMSKIFKENKSVNIFFHFLNNIFEWIYFQFYLKQISELILREKFIYSNVSGIK